MKNYSKLVHLIANSMLSIELNNFFRPYHLKYLINSVLKKLLEIHENHKKINSQNSLKVSSSLELIHSYTICNITITDLVFKFPDLISVELQR